MANAGTGAFPAPADVQTEEGARHIFPILVPEGVTREVTYGLLTRPVAAAIDPEGEGLTGARVGARGVLRIDHALGDALGGEARQAAAQARRRIVGPCGGRHGQADGESHSRHHDTHAG